MQHENFTLHVLVFDTARKPHSRSDDAAGQGEDGRSGKPWRKPIYAGGRRNFAPAVVFQNARFRGRSMPIVGNISDMTKEGFRDVSSMK